MRGSVVILTVILLGAIFCARAWAETPMPPGTLSVPVGIYFSSMDVVTFWNEYAYDDDYAGSWYNIYNQNKVVLLDSSTVRQKAIFYANLDHTQDVIAQAREHGVENIVFNLELSTTGAELVRQEIEARNLVEAAGLTYLFAPTRRDLEKYYQDMVLHTDTIFLQTQSLQIYDYYATSVTIMIQKMKEVNPSLKIWGQVSVNPPEGNGKRMATAEEVIACINQIRDIVDEFQIYSSTTPDRIEVVKQVIRHFRIPPPKNLAACPVSSASVQLNWSHAADNETDFIIERRTREGGVYVPVANVPAGAVAWSDTDVVPDTVYYYRLYASAADSNSPYSSAAMARTPAAPLPAPRNLRLSR